MVNVKAKKVEEKSSKQKQIGQEKKISEKQKTSRGKQQSAKKAINNSAVKKRVKGTTSKRVAQKKSPKKNLHKGASKEDTLKIGETNKREKVENFIEELSRKPEPIDQKKIPIVEVKNFLKKYIKRFRGSA